MTKTVSDNKKANDKISIPDLKLYLLKNNYFFKMIQREGGREARNEEEREEKKGLIFGWTSPY